ncbi:MAG: hypothetical protein Q8Q46_03860 [Candidatus Giovannonibacteria bacterium]|nr:hypothetical protein [Candidatus Giovannonibacteria bacterium]
MGTHFEWKAQMLVVVVIGVANAVACYWHWKATAINQAITSLSTWLDDIIPLALGLFVLNEFQLLNAMVVMGIMLAVGSAVLFATQTTSLNGIKPGAVLQIYKYILAYSFIWGVAGFSMRYLAVKNDMQVWDFISSWYSGSLIGALMVYRSASSVDKGDSSTLREAMQKVAMLTGSVVSSLTVTYWAKSLVPLVFTQPIFMVSEMIFPTMIGLFIFGEAKHFTRLGWLLMLCGLIGGLIIATHL